ncbi:MAG: ABC-2 family transporter protein [Methanocella sp. PtaU1.Bin125]|nr:MAG: ABC-2 family transporter protein [Methanocella sp. PtaU1.Bin125]
MSTDFLIVMRKDLDEVMRNRYIVSSMATFPVLFSIVIPLLYLFTVPANVTEADVAALGNVLHGYAGMTPRQAMIAFLVQSNLPFYLLMPGVMPTLIAAYSIAGEKKNGTLEPMLATPVKTSDILLGKTLAAVVPSVLITWISFIVYMALINTVTSRSFGFSIVPDPQWAVALAITGPLIAILSVYASIMVSARMSDVRAAQQVSAALVVPIMGLFVLQLFGMITLSLDIIVAISAALFVLDIVLIRIGTLLFRRDEILTTWG